MIKLIGIIIILVIIESEAFPFGAPSSACSNLVPLHIPSQATGSIPYEVDLSAIATYVPGQSYNSKLIFSCTIITYSSIAMYNQEFIYIMNFWYN